MTTIKLYRYQSMDDYELGRGPSYLLGKYILDSNQWYDEERYILPDGYTVATGNDGCPHVYDAHDQYVPIVTNRAGLPALLIDSWQYRLLSLESAAADRAIDKKGGNKMNEMCVVNIAKLSIYDFVRAEKSAEKILHDAVKQQKKDIQTWETLCKAHPEAEYFRQFLQEAKEATFEIMSFDRFLDLQRERYLALPLKEVSGEEFEEHLNELPPLKWCTINDIEMFCQPEMYTGTYTGQYAHDRKAGKYYTKIVDVFDESTWIHTILS